MAQQFARAFYNSVAWRQVRADAYARDGGVCVECAKRGFVSVGEIVHHKTALTAVNINDQAIALGLDNLVTVCRKCHARLHGYTKSATREGFYFDASGNLCHESQLGQGLH